MSQARRGQNRKSPAGYRKEKKSERHGRKRNTRRLADPETPTRARRSSAPAVSSPTSPPHTTPHVYLRPPPTLPALNCKPNQSHPGPQSVAAKLHPVIHTHAIQIRATGQRRTKISFPLVPPSDRFPDSSCLRSIEREIVVCAGHEILPVWSQIGV